MAALPPLGAAPAVAVVIPARDAARTLAGAVESAVDQQAPDGLEVAIAVAPSQDDTLEVATQLAGRHDGVLVVHNPAGTTPAGLNLAIVATTAPVVVRLDAHAVLPAGYVHTAIEVLQDPTIANVGGRQIPTAAGGFAEAVARAMSSPVGTGGAAYRHGRASADVDTVYLGVFRRQALEEVGGFDERLARNQDYELNHRLRAAGYRVRYEPSLEVAYRPRSTPRALWRQYLAYGVWKRRVLLLHPTSVRLRQVVAPSLVLALLTGVAIGTAAGAWGPLALVVGTYAVVVLAAGLAAGRDRLALVPRIAFALTLMHLAWGVGFLVGRAGGGAPDQRSGPDTT
ncbi:MAG TPA: glycosyltransferase family 2 protein [Nitriliruptorales bacterium]